MIKFIPAFLLLLFLFSCHAPEKTPEQVRDEIHRAKIQKAYDTLLEYHQAWTNAELQLMFWVDNRSETKEKKELAAFLTNGYPKMATEIDSISVLAGDPDVKHLTKNMDELAAIMKDIISELNTFAAYETPETVFNVEGRFENDGGDAVIAFRKLENDFEIQEERFRGELKHPVN